MIEVYSTISLRKKQATFGIVSSRLMQANDLCYDSHCTVKKLCRLKYTKPTVKFGGKYAQMLETEISDVVSDV